MLEENERAGYWRRSELRNPHQTGQGIHRMNRSGEETDDQASSRRIPSYCSTSNIKKNDWRKQTYWAWSHVVFLGCRQTGSKNTDLLVFLFFFFHLFKMTVYYTHLNINAVGSVDCSFVARVMFATWAKVELPRAKAYSRSGGCYWDGD